jgi:hypothetical protein
MKNKAYLSVLFSITAFLLLLALNTQAKVWRVNNRVGVDADYTSLANAISSPLVNPGDTIYLEASSGSHGNITLTKRLVIIGPGFFLAENPETQADVNSAVIGAFTFSSGSNGSIIKGCRIHNIIVNSSDIIIKGNLISGSTSNTIRLGADIANVIIQNNYIQNNYNSMNSTVIAALESGTNNIIIKNNYIDNVGTYSSSRSLYLLSGFSGIIENNVISKLLYVSNAEFHNNILTTGTFQYENVNFTHNIANGTQFGVLNGNQQNANMSNVFLGPTGNSTDGQWQLRPGSPAIGTGVGGTNVGMFGGATPYKLSGMPNIPAIYELNHSIDYENQLLEIDFSVKSHN